MNTFLVKCKCQHCSQNIEFDSESAGQLVNCPNCGMETLLFIPDASPLPPPPEQKEISKEFHRYPPVISSKRSSPDLATALGRIISNIIQAMVCCMAIALFVIGAALVLGGCKAEIDETNRVTSSAIRQNVYVVQYCTGFILMGLSPIVFASARLIEWFRDHGEKESS